MIRGGEELTKIARAGGGFTVNAAGRSKEDLVQIATAAADRGGQIHISHVAQMTTDELVEIATAGKGCVFFEL